MRAKKSLGQNFLVDPNLQQKIVAALDPGPDDLVVEIGPGRGALTERLVPAAGRVVAVELDDELAAGLAAQYHDDPGVTIVHRDVLEWDPRPVVDAAPYKVVGNIPYNITSPILFRILEWKPRPERIVLMVQKEVADRIVAAPGTRAYGALSVGVRAQTEVERLFGVGRGAFRPVPNVDSTVLRLWPREEPAAVGQGGALRSLTRAAFGLRRKQLQKILRTARGYEMDAAAAEAVLREVGVEPETRPEGLSPERFVELAALLGRRGYPRGDA